MKLGWAPWTAPIALAVATLLALVLGLLSAHSTGIYFLMLTLTYAVIGFYFFGQVTTFSGFGGMTGIDAPAFFLGQPKRLYYAVLGTLGPRVRRISLSPARRSGWRCRVSGTTRSEWPHSASTSSSTARWRSPWRDSWPELPACSTSGGNGQIDPDLDRHRSGARPVHHRRDRRHHAPRGCLARCVPVRGCDVYLRDIPLVGRLAGVFEDRCSPRNGSTPSSACCSS